MPGSSHAKTETQGRLRFHKQHQDAMTETIRYRYRLRFAKTIDLRFTGHLDLHRALERTLRRASLPLAYTQGFNPRPRLNLASALPLGFASECELADFWFEEELSADQILADLQLASPPGLQILALGIFFTIGLFIPFMNDAEHLARHNAANTLPVYLVANSLYVFSWGVLAYKMAGSIKDRVILLGGAFTVFLVLHFTLYAPLFPEFYWS